MPISYFFYASESLSSNKYKILFSWFLKECTFDYCEFLLRHRLIFYSWIDRIAVKITFMLIHSYIKLIFQLFSLYVIFEYENLFLTNFIIFFCSVTLCLNNRLSWALIYQISSYLHFEIHKLCVYGIWYDRFLAWNGFNA